MRNYAVGRMSLSSLQKYIIVIHIVDEFIGIGESITLKWLKKFVKRLNAIFGIEYLRKMNKNDIQHLLRKRYMVFIENGDHIHKTISIPQGQKRKLFTPTSRSNKKGYGIDILMLQS
ncbi:hypothetical protein CR513_05703, partial [Mucuna pruriens]